MEKLLEFLYNVDMKTVSSFEVQKDDEVSVAFRFCTENRADAFYSTVLDTYYGKLVSDVNYDKSRNTTTVKVYF